jgi:hypothetical protein
MGVMCVYVFVMMIFFFLVSKKNAKFKTLQTRYVGGVHIQDFFSLFENVGRL